MAMFYDVETKTLRDYDDRGMPRYVDGPMTYNPTADVRLSQQDNALAALVIWLGILGLPAAALLVGPLILLHGINRTIGLGLAESLIDVVGGVLGVFCLLFGCAKAKWVCKSFLSLLTLGAIVFVIVLIIH